MKKLSTTSELVVLAKIICKVHISGRSMSKLDIDMN
jgi:hypothetical protein